MGRIYTLAVGTTLLGACTAIAGLDGDFVVDSSGATTTTVASTTAASGGGGGASPSSTTGGQAGDAGSATAGGSGGAGGVDNGPLETVLLPLGSVYRYHDLGEEPANWADAGFDDSGWKMGAAPLGFGDAYIVTTVGFGPSAQSKYITTWFRTTFDATGAGSVVGARLELMRDDGARAVLNGTEVARSNLPDGALTSNTLASNITDGFLETMVFAFEVDPALLVEGPNVLAIELHQAVANSSDLGFDARMSVEVRN